MDVEKHEKVKEYRKEQENTKMKPLKRVHALLPKKCTKNLVALETL